MNKTDKENLRTWVEIDRKSIKHNYNVFRKVISKKTKLMSVVKSNAYGHSLVDFSREVRKLGVDWLGVDTAVEALALRKQKIGGPVLILGYTLPGLLNKAVDSDVSICISSFRSLKALEQVRSKKAIKIHIKVDTGMGRQGFLESDLGKVLKELKALKKKKRNLEIEGLFTHFTAAKNPSFPQYTFGQIALLKKWIDEFKKAGYEPIIHAAASSATLIFPESHFDMVRVGISMYGLWPSPEVESFCRNKYFLNPVLSWKTIIGEVKTLPKGSQVGYDLTETLYRNSQVAVCPIGYWHGFPRALSSVGNVLVKGKRARVIGRVSMDMISIDVTGINGVKAGDEVVILGKQGREEVTADESAHLSDTTNYEVVTRINPLIKRIYK